MGEKCGENILIEPMVIKVDTREGVIDYIVEAMRRMIYSNPHNQIENGYNKGLMDAKSVCDALKVQIKKE